MTREAIIERTVKAIHSLPDEKAEQISDFADFVLKQYEEQLLTQGIAKLSADSQAFEFLNDDPELYSVTDIKGPYNG